MRFLRIGPQGHEKPAVLDDRDQFRDLSALVSDIDPGNLATLSALTPDSIARLPILPPSRIGPCLSGIPNIIAIGLNYSRHAQETDNPIPAEPLVFAKHTSSVGGPFDDIEIPPGAACVDWEVELGVVIGKPAYRIAEDRALAHVFGYCTVNDVSERDLQLRRGGQWSKGKSNPGFAPIGPWLVRADAVPDPQDLPLLLEKDGIVMQSSSTSDMIFPVARLVSYLSEFMRLMPGDLIFTGTPEGIGSRRMPPVFIRPGSTISAEVKGLGRQTNRFFDAGSGDEAEL